MFRSRRPARSLTPTPGTRRVRRRWVSAAVLAATGPLAGVASADSQPAPPDAATVTTAEDVADGADGLLSLREALDLVMPGGTGVRFDVPAPGGAAPVFRLSGDLPAGRGGVNVHLDDANAGPIGLLIESGSAAAGPQRLDANFRGGGTVVVDLGTGAAAELRLNGRNGHARTRVNSGTAVGGSLTAFGRELVIENGGVARLESDLYLGRLSGAGTLNLGDATLTLGLVPNDPEDLAAGADGPGYGSTFAGSIAGTDRGVLHKAGTGTVSLTGVNTHGGGTRITGGVLKVNSAQALGAGGILLDNNATLHTTGVLNDRLGRTGDDGAALAAALIRTVTIQAGGGVIDLGGHDQLLGGTITGAGGLAVKGGGTLTLAGHNTHRGGTSVVGGTTLVLASQTALGTADLGVDGSTVRTAHTSGGPCGSRGPWSPGRTGPPWRPPAGTGSSPAAPTPGPSPKPARGSCGCSPRGRSNPSPSPAARWRSRGCRRWAPAW